MAVKLVSMTCPSCGAQIDVPADRDRCFCTYCGTQVVVDDGSYTVTHRVVDEARMINAKEDARFKLEALGKRSELVKFGLIGVVAITALTLVVSLIGSIRGDEDAFFPFIMLIMFLFPFGLFVIMTSSRDGNKKDVQLEDGQIRMPVSSYSLQKTDVEEAVRVLESAGLAHVSTIAMHDINVFKSITTKEGAIEDATADGESWSAGDIFSKDAHIILRYHSR